MKIFHAVRLGSVGSIGSVLVLVLIPLIAFFCNLGAYPLLDNNEGIYGQISLHMANSGDYVLPHLNGLVYIEKPPLLYWLTAICFRLFGINEFSARIVPAASALLTGVVLALFLARQTRNETGSLALLIWSSLLGVLLFSRVLFFDMLMTLWVSTCVICLYLRLHGARRPFLYAAYAAAAAAVLTKGILGIAIPGMVIVIYIYFLSNDFRWQPNLRLIPAMWRRIVSLLSPVGIIIFLLLAVPWHIAAAQADPGFLWFYFINEHVLRFLGRRQPVDYYSGPFWYYLPRFAVYLCPWILLVPFLWRRKNAAPEETTALHERETPLRTFLWIWLLSIFTFFSLSEAKANYYIILAAPPAAALLALTFQRHRQRLLQRGALTGLITFMAITVALMFLLVPPLCALLPAGCRHHLRPVNSLGTIVPPLIGCTLVIWLAWKDRIRRSLPASAAILAGLTVVIGATASGLLSRYETEFSTRLAFRDLSAHRIAVRQVYLYRGFEELSTAPFYLGKPIGMIDGNCDDLEYGMKKIGLVPDFIALRELRDNPQPRWILMRKKRLNRFKAEYGRSDFRIWKDYGRIILLTNIDPLPGAPAPVTVGLFEQHPHKPRLAP